MQFPILYDVPALGSQVLEDNIGGIRQLRLIPAEQLTLLAPERFPALARSGYDANTISSQHLSFSTGAKIVDVFVRPDYCSFSEPAERSTGGLVYRPAIQLMLPKVRPDVVNWVSIYGDVRWVAFIQDRNLVARVVGTPDQPLKLAPTSGQGMAKAPGGSSLIFTGETSQPAYFATGIGYNDLQLSGAFSDAFGFMFDS